MSRIKKKIMQYPRTFIFLSLVATANLALNAVDLIWR